MSALEIEEKSQTVKGSPFKIKPTLLRRAHALRLFLAGIAICIVTLFVFNSALLHEMSGIYAARPIETFSLILAFSFLLGSSILLYPILVVHYRYRVLFKEEVKRLNMKYHEGLQEFQRLREEYVPSTPSKRIDMWKDIVEAMSQDAKYTDFAYLHMTLLDFLGRPEDQEHEEIVKRLMKEKQTFEQVKKDYIRQLINATAEETLEDTTYDIPSYEMPVAFCMLAVAFGFIISSLVPFLGTGKIQFGNASLNLVWATGGFLGAYMYSLYPFVQRYTRRDLPPRAFLHYSLKIFLGTLAVTIFGNLFLDVFTEGYQFAIAAVLGSVPFLVMGRAKEYTFKKLGWDSAGSEIGNQDLDNITGITRDYAERLHEEGIMNIQNLAFTDVEILSKRTMLSKSMVFNWKDDAILRLLTGNIGIKTFLDDSKESGGKETLYDALSNVGINNITTLASRLKCRRHTREEKEKENEEYVTDTKSTSLLVKTLGWKDNEEYRYLLERICVQGKKMLGDPTQTSITAFAYK